LPEAESFSPQRRTSWIVTGPLGGQLSTVAQMPGWDVMHLSLAPGGELLAGARRDIRAGLRVKWPDSVLVWRVNSDGTLTAVAESTASATGPGRSASDWRPEWVPDGSCVFFARNVVGPPPAGRGVCPQWWEIWALDWRRGTERRVVTGLPDCPAWTVSRDGSQLYVASSQGISAYDATAASVRQGAKTPVRVPGVVVSLVALEGQRVAAVAFGGATGAAPVQREMVLVADMRTGEHEVLAEGALGRGIAAGPDGTTIAFTDACCTEGVFSGRILSVPAGGGAVTTIARVPGTGGGAPLLPAPKGQFVFVGDGGPAVLCPSGRRVFDVTQPLPPTPGAGSPGQAGQ